MDFTPIFIAPLVVFLVFVAPIWIFAHYATRWRTSRMLSSEDEKMLSDLWESAATMETRINTLERILDAEVPEWRKQV